MQTYPVSREAKKGLDLKTLKGHVQNVFGDVPVTIDGGMIHTSFLAIRELKVGTDGKGLLVETLMSPGVPEADQIETIRRYNKFLEAATGLSAKERAKKLQAEAKKGPR